MTYQLVIRNASIIDGTGDEPFAGDVAIDGDKITALGKVDGRGREEIDAAGNAVTVAYNQSLSNLGRLQLLGTYAYTGERDANIGNLPDHELPDYTRLDLRASWFSPNESLSATLFVRNVMDEIGVIEFLPRSTTAERPAMGTLTQPRQVGLRLTYRPGL